MIREEKKKRVKIGQKSDLNFNDTMNADINSGVDHKLLSGEVINIINDTMNSARDSNPSYRKKQDTTKKRQNMDEVSRIL